MSATSAEMTHYPLCRFAPSPLQGDIASVRGNPGHGDRWVGLLRGQAARWVLRGAGDAQAARNAETL